MYVYLNSEAYYCHLEMKTKVLTIASFNRNYVGAPSAHLISSRAQNSRSPLCALEQRLQSRMVLSDLFSEAQLEGQQLFYWDSVRPVSEPHILGPPAFCSRDQFLDDRDESKVESRLTSVPDPASILSYCPLSWIWWVLHRDMFVGEASLCEAVMAVIEEGFDPGEDWVVTEERKTSDMKTPFFASL